MSENRAPMKPRMGRKFRKETRYLHQRSEGMTDRRNGGSHLQPSMAKHPDPFGFLAAINWDAVEEHADEIEKILGETK